MFFEQGAQVLGHVELDRRCGMRRNRKKQAGKAQHGGKQGIDWHGKHCTSKAPRQTMELRC